MARALKHPDYGDRLDFDLRLETDRHMPPGAMRAYLQHRLYAVEAQIGVVFDELNTGRSQAAERWVSYERSPSEEMWVYWTELHSLMWIRDALKGLLRRSKPGSC